MSIIHDALKKAQVRLEEHRKRFIHPKTPIPSSEIKPNPKPSMPPFQQATSIPANSAPPPTSAQPRFQSRPTGLILSITLIFVVILIYALRQTNEKSIQTYQVITPATSTASSTNQPLIKSSARSSKLILGGTIILDKKRAAIINNEVYEIGGIVNGKKIINITLEKVELQNENGEILTLTPGKN
jgi:hypothetical protein